MAILTILILPIQECGISFHFFESFLVSFINVLWFSTYVFHLLGAVYSSVLYFRAYDFKRNCLFTFPFCYFISVKKCNGFNDNLATLLNSFISFSSFCVASLGFPLIWSYHLHIMTNLPLPYHLNTFHFFFSCVIAVASLLE